MFCTHCGNEVEQHARFCSKCGHEVTALTTEMTTAPVAPKKAHDMDMHINILGWLLIAQNDLAAAERWLEEPG